LVNYFPANRSFSLLGNKTDAVFTALPGATSANPIDTNEYFVRQQYRLSESGTEPEGLAFWTSKQSMLQAPVVCGGANRCLGGVLPVAEFRNGSFVYRVYQEHWVGKYPTRIRERSPAGRWRCESR
jgi:hypothetical protein